MRLINKWRVILVTWVLVQVESIKFYFVNRHGSIDPLPDKEIQSEQIDPAPVPASKPRRHQVKARARKRIVRNALEKTVARQIKREESNPKVDTHDRAPFSQTFSPVWTFRSGILDRLDEYFDCMKQLKRIDPDSYALYSQVGFSIPMNAYKASPDFRIDFKERPAFGGILVGTSSEENIKKVSPSFMYFQKLSHPSQVQWMSEGETYKVTAIYDSRKNERYRSFPLEYHVMVDTDGRVKLLKQMVSITSRIQPGRRHSGGKKPDPFDLSLTRWDYPEVVKIFAQEHGESNEEWAKFLFLIAFETTRMCQEQIVVRVKQSNLTAAFGIELPSAKTFFRDRDKTLLAVDGKRKRIFHSVVAHSRVSLVHKNEVKAHYRGIRHFDWQTYGINIVLPDKKYILDCPVPAIQLEDMPPESVANSWDMKKLGGFVDQELIQ